MICKSPVVEIPTPARIRGSVANAIKDSGLSVGQMEREGFVMAMGGAVHSARSSRAG